MTGVHLAVDLVNLESSSSWSAPAAEAVLRRHEIRRPTLSEAVGVDLAGWSRRLRTVFEAGSSDELCAVVNALLADGTHGVVLTTHDGLRPHLHLFSEDQDKNVGSRVRAVTAGGLALFTVAAEGERLGVCARPACTVVFADTSRNGLRRFCSVQCANADAVRRYRGRRSTQI